MSDIVNPDSANAESDESPRNEEMTHGADSGSAERESETFSRAYVEGLRQENGKYRQRAQNAEKRLLTELVRATGKLADPSDFADFNSDYLDNPDSLHAAIDELLETKPHLKARKVSGDVGQGNRGSAQKPADFSGLFK